MSQRDLFIENPNPTGAQIDVTCANCHHFADVPYYTIDGKKTVCSNERIGRRGSDVPCPHFSINMSIFKHMKPAAMRKLTELLAVMELDYSDDKTKVQKSRDMRSLADLALVLRALYNGRKLGFDLGGDYTIANSNVEGTLVSLSRSHATIRTKDGVSYTADHGQISKA